MEYIKMIFNACAQIWRINIDLFGFSVSLREVIIFVFLGGLLLHFAFSFFKG